MSSPFSNQECLTVRLSALGDAILTTGVLQYWHEKRNLSFRVVTRPALAPVFENHPAVSDIIPVHEEDLSGIRWVSFCRDLARQCGHLPLVDLHANLRTKILGALWPGPVRTYPKRSLSRRLYLLTRHPFFSTFLTRDNVPQRYALALDSVPPAKSLLLPRIVLRTQELEEAAHRLQTLGLQRPLVLHPYATHPAKTPRAATWQDLSRTLEAQGHEILILGRNAAPLFPGSPHDLTNSTDLRQTTALIALSRCLVTGDSGPMHLATAVGTPVLGLFGPTVAEWGFYPAGPKDLVVQSPCPMAPCSLHGQDTCARDNACMNSISHDTLLTHLNILLQHS